MSGTTVREAVEEAIGEDEAAKANSPGTLMAIALAATSKPIYANTVPPAVKARRRAANKRARIARRAGR